MLASCTLNLTNTNCQYHTKRKEFSWTASKASTLELPLLLFTLLTTTYLILICLSSHWLHLNFCSCTFTEIPNCGARVSRGKWIWNRDSHFLFLTTHNPIIIYFGCSLITYDFPNDHFNTNLLPNRNSCTILLCYIKGHSSKHIVFTNVSLLSRYIGGKWNLCLLSLSPCCFYY